MEYKELKARGFEPVLSFNTGRPAESTPSPDVLEIAQPTELPKPERAPASRPRDISLTEKRLREQAAKERPQNNVQSGVLTSTTYGHNDDIGAYTDYMADLITSHWARPPSARPGMQVTLEIALGAAGRVKSVTPVISSGNEEFDASAAIAVWKVTQFEKLREMDPGLYQQEFRKIDLVFRPDNLRM